MVVMKIGKKHKTEGVEISNQEIRTPEEKKQQIFRILEADTMKRQEMKEKKIKNITEEPVNYYWQNSRARTLSQG